MLWEEDPVTNQELVQQQIHALFSEIQYLIRLLYVTHDPSMKNLTLNQLWNQVSQLQFLTQLQVSAYPQTMPAPPVASTTPAAPLMPSTPDQPQLPAASSAQIPQQSFTRSQLAQFDGRNGKPAYVAVKGTVYDVTNNAAWSAATHFGLSAGKDLTQEFASCHAAEQWILNTLIPVGRLLD